jgi:hypothetical protein
MAEVDTLRAHGRGQLAGGVCFPGRLWPSQPLTAEGGCHVPTGVTVADLRSGVLLSGVRPGLVTVVAATPLADSVNVVFRDATGRYGDRLLYSTDLAASIRSRDARRSFDADGAEFRLAAEAQRIRMAGIHDPMLAVTTSDIRSLPSKPFTRNCYSKHRCASCCRWPRRRENPNGRLLRETAIRSPAVTSYSSREWISSSPAPRTGATSERSEWDLIVVDEAHRLSANWWAGELRKTRRY